MGALVIANSDGATFRAALNAALAQLGTQSAGNARPSDAGAGTIWVDKNTPSATLWSVFFYDGADDVLMGYVNTTTNVYIPANAMLSGMGKGHITGLTWANNGSDPTNDIDIAAGWCMDGTGARQLQLSALTKRLDAGWTVGTNQGGLDTGSIGNSDYYIWAIERSDTGVTDVLFSLSATAPTMPANYDYKRLVGWFKRVGGSIVGFKTYETAGGGIEMMWDVPTLDVNLANTLTTSNRTDAVKVPLNFSVTAILNVAVIDASATGLAWIFCPDQTGAAPSVSAAPLYNVATTTGFSMGTQLHIRTSATGTIGARSSLATVDSYVVATLGFIWSRR